MHAGDNVAGLLNERAAPDVTADAARDARYLPPTVSAGRNDLPQRTTPASPFEEWEDIVPTQQWTGVPHLVAVSGRFELRRVVAGERPDQGQLLCDVVRVRGGWRWRTATGSGVVGSELAGFGVVARQAGQLPCERCGQGLLWRASKTAAGRWTHLEPPAAGHVASPGGVWASVLDRLLS